MDFSKTGKMNFSVDENIETKEKPLDLRTYKSISRESENQQSVNENQTIRETKRRRECATYLIGEVKQDEKIKQLPQNMLEGLEITIPMVEIPFYPLIDFGSGIVDITDSLPRHKSVKKELEYEDFTTVPRYRMSTAITATMQEELVDELDKLNISLEKPHLDTAFSSD